MKDHLRDLINHCLWADDVLWQSIAALPAAQEDASLFIRQHHIHLVQHAFLSVLQGTRPDIRKPEDFASLAALKDWWLDFKIDIMRLMDTVSDERLDEAVTIPWFRNPPCVVTVEQALTQVAMHSHYHRGQNATRLRDLGGNPQLTDYIVWLWKHAGETRLGKVGGQQAGKE
jgi:uncharacterized damage-inducible protein DinB